MTPRSRRTPIPDPNPAAFHGHFELDVPKAIVDQLTQQLEALTPAPLSEQGSLKPPSRLGVYALHHAGKTVYVGKAEKLRRRIEEHAFNLAGRRNIGPTDVGFVCMTIGENWNAFAPEGLLIDAYRARGLCEWNGSAFGNHDPGRNRELTDKDPEGFDATFPIRDDYPCDWLRAGAYDLLQLLLSLKEHLPYLLRFQSRDRHRWREGHADYRDKKVVVPGDSVPAREALRLIVQQLPGWQATVFPSHMILYKENRVYKYGVKL